MQRTNILLITADDMEGTTPGAFGGLDGVTPWLDRLASDGTVFERAHVPIAVCQPSRSALMTGRWPHRNGAEGFEPIDDGVPLLPNLLSSAGYAVGILGKVTHLQPVERFAWDHAVDMGDLGMGRDAARYGEEMQEFLRQRAGRPWFLMLNAHDPHRPFHGAQDVGKFFDVQQQEGIPAPSRIYTAGEAGAVPGYLPELPEVRTEYAQYLSSARRCDDVVGAALTVLEESGEADRTLVIFLSDNGMAFPFSKANCYLQSTRTPLIVRWPGQVEEGRREEQSFVSTLDLFTTLCEVAGIDAPESDGRSLLGLLRGSATRHRDHVVSVFHETAAGRRYEMRSVQDEKYGYIWNGWAGKDEYRAENMIGLTWPAMLEATDSDPEVARRVEFYKARQDEELYELARDPHCLHDLSAMPEHAQALARMRSLMSEWMEETIDPCAADHARVTGAV
jgi:N-sulfoglucosamine sulfohydrolase